MRRLARKAIYDDGAITDSDLPEVMKAKYELIGGDGLLTFEYDTQRFADVGGMANAKRWLSLRRAAFHGEAAPPGLEPPRGLMLLGVQGCGKSLLAKAVAGIFAVPLLRLDFGALYDRFYGESEKNLREALRSAEVMSPCVLWADEVEKGIAADTSDGGTSRRVLGTLLTWMAERSAPVFMVATANDISRLPPELIRKGRFDEIFFVDLPDASVRTEILRIHLRKRGLAPGEFDLPALARASEG
ncbi:MAG: AAA family ATPase, partial [Pseudolabrys sp.]